MITARPDGGTGMLAVFCDLEPQWRREFREWLRDDMMPARLAIGFLHCASYDLIPTAPVAAGAPEPFATVYETASLGDLYAAPYQDLRVTRDARDTAFHARFIKPARYTLAWLGPDLATAPAHQATAGFAPVAVFDRLDLPAAAVQDFNVWYVTSYLPRLANIRGVTRVRRYVAMEGAPRHVIVHELDSASVLAGPDWIEGRTAFASAAIPATQRTSGAYARALAASL